ncbi:hypothetical protein ACFLU1_02410 [Chloroflexota bacterium]
MIERWQIKEPAHDNRVVRVAARVLLTLILALSLIGSVPVQVEAAAGGPVDLELGGDGATPWGIGDIVPGDNGTQLVELHNAGNTTGFVTVWISDIISTEGLNPESETGNTAEPGELNNHLLFNISSNRSSTTLNLPATTNQLPQSVSDPNSIVIVPLRSGDTDNLTWNWNLPALTGNDAQGDVLSFTITYLLTELEITDVSGVVEEVTGTFTDNVIVESEPDGSAFRISQGTVGKTKEGKSLKELWFIKINKDPVSPSVDTVSVGTQYDAGPHGSTFDRLTTITLKYLPSDLPDEALEQDLAIATWDENAAEWVELNTTVDTVNKKATATVDHFSRYTLLAHISPPEDDDEIPPQGGISIKDKEVIEEVIKPTLETDILGDEQTVEIETDGTLLEPLSLTDPGGRFIIEVDSGSRITGDDGIPITRIEVTEVEESIVLPGNTVTLSSIYKVTGYIDESEVPMINFEPSARITILYDPRDLPENAFPPYIANYSEERGWVQLEAPSDYFFEIGKAKALIHHASWFAVVAELALPPPPLPAEFRVSNLTISPERSQLGEPVIINLTIANNGAVTGSYEIYLIIDGIVRAVKEITLAGQSVETVSFEVSKLAPGKHQVKIAGLTGEFQIIQAAVTLPAETTVGWIFTDLSVGIIIVTLLLALYLIMRRSQRLQYSRSTVDDVVKRLRRSSRE